MIEMQGIHHVSLAVRDIQRARVFYSEVLQLREIVRPDFGNEGIWYAIAGQQLHLSLHPESQTLRVGEVDPLDGHFAIWATSYQDTIAWLTDRNIPYVTKPNSVAGFAQTWITDPDGNIIEFDTPIPT